MVKGLLENLRLSQNPSNYKHFAIKTVTTITTKNIVSLSWARKKEKRELKKKIKKKR
jgi:hypothetical protein